MLDTEQLALFCRVAAVKNLSAVAREMHISQPAISVRIRRLETVVGTPLFRRSRRGVTLTESGEVFHAAARHVLAILDNAVQEARNVASTASGHLRVGLTATMALYIVADCMTHFERQYPATRLIPYIHSCEELVAMLDQDIIDLALLWGHVRHPGFETEPLGRYELVLIAGADYDLPLPDGGAVLPEVIAKHPLITTRPGSTIRRFIEEQLAAVKISARIAMQLPSTEAVKRAVRSGRGIAIVPRVSIGEELNHGSLRMASIQGVPLTLELVVARRRGAPHHIAESCFVSLLKGTLV